MNGWGAALRIAYRDAWQHRVRSALVLVLIALPVMVVSTALVVIMTADVDRVEQIERAMGAAEAVVWVEGGGGPVEQDPDPFNGSTSWSDSGEPTPEAEDLLEAMGPDARALPMRQGWVDVRVEDRAVITLAFLEVDLHDPLTEGLFRLDEGRLPQGPHEIVVNNALRERGYEIGETLEIPLVDEPATVVGVGRDATSRGQEKALGPIGSLTPLDASDVVDSGDETSSRMWLVDSDPVDWDQVKELNRSGFLVGSRAVLTDPPPRSEWPSSQYEGSSEDAEGWAVAMLIVAMALLEVVLLAGPAFAVTARNHARTLALITASGGTPAQARRVILAGGVVLGGVATLAGLALGIVTAMLILPLAQTLDETWMGPLDVPWLWLAVVGAFGLLSAFGAAFVPAWIASRQDPVAVLAGRRADPAPSRRQPVIGLVVMLVGVAGATYGAINYTDLGALLLTGSALLAVIGMLFVVPLVVSWVAKASRGLPLPARYAARDAARHRTRTVPAVAAVAATVAGVVALGIGASSDELENRETYRPSLAMGDGQVNASSQTVIGEEEVDPEEMWTDARAVVERTAPDVDVTPVQGLQSYQGQTYSYWWVTEPGGDGELVNIVQPTWQDYIVVSDDAGVAVASPQLQEQAEAALAEGKVVVFAPQPSDGATTVDLHREIDDQESDVPGGSQVWKGLPAEYIDAELHAFVSAVVPTAVADAEELPLATSGLLLRGDLDEKLEKKLTEAVKVLSPDNEVTVERGYERDPYFAIVLSVLAGGAALMMLVGSLTATFLALADARPDLATLSAVGASPRSRRGIAASYALTIGGVGGLLGAVVGFVPGVAVSRPLTTSTWYDGTATTTGPFLDVPWLMIVVIVVVLPLLTAWLVWLFSRARLPMVARID